MSGRRVESAATLSMSVMGLTIISMIMLYVGAQTMGSMFVTKRKTENSVGMATADRAIETYRFALQSNLADEFDGYQLTEQDLRRLVNAKDRPRVTIVPSPSQREQTWGLVPSQVPDAARFTVQEQSASGYSYWQVFKVITPKRTHSAASPGADLAVYFRAWTSSQPWNQMGSVTRPRVFRAEFRPGYFSDYQLVTDSVFLVEQNDKGYQVNGPIHSNGYELETLAGPTSAKGNRGIVFRNSTPTCGNRAAFSTSRKATIKVPGNSCKNASRTKTAREVSLLGVDSSYSYIASRCWSNAVLCVERETGLQSPYTVTLGTGQVTVRGRNGGQRASRLVKTERNSASMVILAGGEVTVRGQLRVNNPQLAGRVTIANRRLTSREEAPQIKLQATAPGARVGAADPNKDVVALVTQGDIVLPFPKDRGGCIGSMAFAAVSQTGAVTLPPEFMTQSPPAVDFQRSGNLFICGDQGAKPLSVIGSYAMHGMFRASASWSQGGQLVTPSIGYPNVKTLYTDTFYRNPAPAYPIARPWSTVRAKEADFTCLRAEAGPACE